MKHLNSFFPLLFAIVTFCLPVTLPAQDAGKRTGAPALVEEVTLSGSQTDFRQGSPVISQVNPNAADRCTTLNVTITGSGTDFQQGTGSQGVAPTGVKFITGTTTHFTSSSVTVNSTTSLTASVTIPNNAPVTTNYKVEVVQNNSQTTACTNCFEVKIPNLGQPSVITGDASPCPATSQTYSVTQDANASSYQWSAPAGWTGGSSTSNSITYFISTSASSGNLSVMAIGDSTCFYNSPARTLAVNPLPAMQTSIVPTHVSTVGGSDGAADLTVSGSASPFSYSWSNGDTAQDISNLSSGTYYVTVTDVNNCTIVDSVEISEPVGMLSAAQGRQAVHLEIYPNPVKDGSARLHLSGIMEASTLIVRDVRGKMVRQCPVSPTGQMTLDCTGWAAGLYVVELKGKLAGRTKLIVQ